MRVKTFQLVTYGNDKKSFMPSPRKSVKTCEQFELSGKFHNSNDIQTFSELSPLAVHKEMIFNKIFSTHNQNRSNASLSEYSMYSHTNFSFECFLCFPTTFSFYFLFEALH